MHINSLPTDVLFAFLKPYCEGEHLIHGHLGRPTNVLSVCQRWRQIALPIIFNRIYISYTARLWTNLDVMTCGMKQYPRTVDIRIDSSNGNFVDYLKKVLEKLNLNKVMLGNIANLSFELYAHNIFTDYQEELQLARKEFTDITKNLYALLPNISSLHSDMKPIESILSIFETALLKLYAPQLTQVTVSPMAINSDIHFTKPLSKFKHSWAWSATVLPKINANNLTMLELTCVNESFDWKAFSNKKADDSGVLRFPALEFLSIGMFNRTMYMMDGDVDMFIPSNRFSYILEVPSLLYLNVKVLCPLTCSLLASISTPRTLSKFVMANSYNTRFEFYGFSISDATKLIFEEHYNSSSGSKEADILKLADDLQAIDGVICSAIEAYVDQEISTLEMQHIYWPQVTRLSIYYLVPLSDLLELVWSNLPNLKKLEAYHIKLGDMEDNTFVIPEIQDGSITRIKSKIKSFVYGLGEYDIGAPDKVHKVFEESMAKILKSLEYIGFGKPW